MRNLLKKKVPGVSGFVVTLILVVVAVVLGLLFRDQLSEIFGGWFETVDDTVSGIFTTTT